MQNRKTQNVHIMKTLRSVMKCYENGMQNSYYLSYNNVI